MKYSFIHEVILDKISGEWGLEPDSDDSVKIIRTANFTNLGTIDFSSIVLRKIHSKKIEQKKLFSGDVIIEKSGGSPTQPVGRVVYFVNPDHSTYLCNNFTTVLRPNKTIVFPKFLFYVLFYNHLMKKTLRYQNKTTGIINLQLEKYLNSKIPLPALDDQIRIANVLTRAEKLIAKRKESIKALDELLKSTFLEMFGNPVRNEKGFQIVPLSKFIVHLTSGERGWSKYYSDKGDRFIRSLDVQMNRISMEDAVYITPPKGKENERTKVQSGDILLTITGSCIGRVAYVPTDFEKAYVSQHVAIIRTIKMNSIYLSYYLYMPNGGQLNIKKQQYGQTKPGLNLSQIKAFPILLAPLSLQDQFATIVENVESLKSKYTQNLIELKNLYGSLSQQAFRGELDLSHVPLEKEMGDPVYF